MADNIFRIKKEIETNEKNNIQNFSIILSTNEILYLREIELFGKNYDYNVKFTNNLHQNFAFFEKKIKNDPLIINGCINISKLLQENNFPISIPISMICGGLRTDKEFNYILKIHNDQIIIDSCSQNPVSENIKILDETNTNLENKKCMICFENQRTYMYYNCGHICLCEICAMNQKKNNNFFCIICRKKYLDIMKVFF